MNARKYFWLLNLLTITLCAFFAASAVAKLVESKLPRAPSPRMAVPGPSIDPGASIQTSRDITQILKRNIFCSTCAPVSETPTNKPGAEEGQPASANDEPVKTSLNIKLVATLVSETDKAWSFAAILDATESKAGLYAIGSKIPGDAVITDIMEQRVLLINGGRNEYLDLIEVQETNPEATVGSVDQPGDSVTNRFGHKQPSAQPGIEDIAKGIAKVGEGKYEIQRGTLNKVLGNTTLLARSARIVPSVLNGEPNGFKLYAIRPGSLYSLLGMFNGDTISAINGHAITTPDKALEIYTKLRNATHLSIQFNRRGQDITHEYTIR